MTHHLRPLRMLVLALPLALAASCGGNGTSGTTGPRAAEGVVPFDQEAVKALVAVEPSENNPGCAMEGAATVADTVRQQRALLEAGGAVDERFSCHVGMGDDQWECIWEVSQQLPAGAGGDGDPAAGDGAAFQAVAQVDGAGALIPGALICVAPV